MSYFDQAAYDIRCEWGERGVEVFSGTSDVVVIVDVLSFSTTVEMATSRGAIVFPYRFKDESAKAFAAQHDAQLAGGRGSDAKFSLSPASVEMIPSGTRLVLPSPNGAALTLLASGTTVVAGCLRNAAAVARFASKFKRIAVIPAGERWEDGGLRPSIEDLLGAGAIISRLSGSRSPEAQLVCDAFAATRDALQARLLHCASGRELAERGYARDVELASMLDFSECVPVLRDGAFTDETSARI